MNLNFVPAMAIFCRILHICSALRNRQFELNIGKSGFNYQSKSKNLRLHVPSILLCASYSVLDDVTSFSYNHQKNTCRTYLAPICDNDMAEPSEGADLYSSAVSSCEETPCTGTYTLDLCNNQVKVKCEHDEHGIWTVIQQRSVENLINFDRNWDEYKKGFGDLEQFWIGNDILHCLTKDNQYQLKIEFVNTAETGFHALYGTFVVDSEENDYKCLFGNYADAGTAGDYLLGISGAKFSTKDRGTAADCALKNKGGWWYHLQNGLSCGFSYLNAMTGFKWGGLTGIGKTKMMIKKKT